MDDPRQVGRRQALGNLRRQAERVVHRQGSLLQQAPQRLPPHVLHGNEDDAIRFADLEDARDVRVIDRGLGAGLMEQAPTALRVGNQLGREDLQSDLTPELRVLRLPHNSHAALADLLEEAVVGELVVGIEGHSRSADA